MNTKTLNMIFKLKEWQEELEKQKFAQLISEKQRLQTYLMELEQRFSISLSINSQCTSEELATIYSEINYLISQLEETQKMIEKIDIEIENQRQNYEEAFKERRKIEQLYDRILSRIRTEREKVEEKVVNDIFLSRFRSE
ncbi:MAG: hypothetical protein RMI30_04790 [Thermodesulfovibrio sp.]|nr:hypothetical protein [Thermodesulfovibrio sp.]MDW7998753.1 hypothetical protein [Thermodesulfovibrio sp.]